MRRVTNRVSLRSLYCSRCKRITNSCEDGYRGKTPTKTHAHILIFYIKTLLNQDKRISAP